VKLRGGQLPATSLRGRKREREPVMMKDRVVEAKSTQGPITCVC